LVDDINLSAVYNEIKFQYAIEKQKERIPSMKYPCRHHLLHRSFFTLWLTAIFLLALAGLAPFAQADSSVPTSRADYLSTDQYASFGFSGLKDPGTFASTDTTNPLADYTPSTLSELYMGQINRYDYDQYGHEQKNYEGNFFIAQNPSTGTASELAPNNMEKNTIGGVQNYYDLRSDSSVYSQCKNVVAFRPGNLTDNDAPSRKDVIVENTLYTTKKNDGSSKQMLRVLSLDDNNQYHSGQTTINDLGGGDWVSDITVRNQQGYLAMACGDFDNDNYNEVAVYEPGDYGGRIDIYQPFQSGDAWFLAIQASWNIKSSGDRFNFSDGTERPIVNLTTTRMSGRDDLVVCVSMPFDNNHTGNSECDVLRIDGNDVTRSFFDGLEYSGTRYRFAASANADLNGDGVDELVVAGNRNTGYSDKDSKKGDIDGGQYLTNVLLWDKSSNSYAFAWSSPKTMHGNGDVAGSAGDAMNNPVALTAGRFAAGNPQDTVFCGGSYYTFPSTISGNDGIIKGTLTCDASKDFKMHPDDPGVEFPRDYYIGQAVTAGFFGDARDQEQMVIFYGCSYGSTKDKVDGFLTWVYQGQDGILKDQYTDTNFMRNMNEDDNGTCVTIAPVNADNDTAYVQYQGKTVGWSNPGVLGITLSSPYWRELDYGSSGTSRGTTTFGYNTSTSSAVTGNGSIGQCFAISSDVFTGIGKTEASVGFSIEESCSYVGSYQTSHLTGQSLPFTGNAGSNYVDLVVTPLTTYKYNVWIPEHHATQDEVDAGKAARVGDTIAGYFDDMQVTTQQDPVAKSLTLTQYNAAVNQYNATLAGGDKDPYALSIIDPNTLTPGLVLGDPSTYPSSFLETNAARKADGTIDTDTALSSTKVNVGYSPGSKYAPNLTESTTTTSSNGFSATLKVTEKVSQKVGFFIGESGTYQGGFTGSGGATWSTTNTSGTTYSGDIMNLPASAAPTGGATSSPYNFTASLAKWTTPLAGAKTVDYKDGEATTKVTERAIVVGYLVDGDSALGLPPSLPTDFHVAAATKNSLLLQWTNTMDNRKAGSYKVYYSKTNDNYQPVKSGGSDLIVDGSASYALVSGLDAGTTYYFKLEAYSGTGATGLASVKSSPAQGATRKEVTPGSGAGTPVITVPPKDVYANVGEAAGFSITAESSVAGEALTYQWQRLDVANNYQSSWQDIAGQTGPTFNAAWAAEKGVITDNNKDDLDGTIYRCVVTETSPTGNHTASLESRSAILHIGDSVTTLSLNVSKDDNPGSVVEVSDDGRSVAAVPNKALTITGDLAMTGSNAVVNQTIQVFAISADKKVTRLTGTTENTGHYSATFNDGLEAGTYTLAAFYPGSDNTGSGRSTANTIALTIMAPKVQHAITYELDGGINALDNPSVFTEDSGVIALAAPTKEGAAFTGWHRAADLSDPVVSQIDCAQETEDITLYAAWKNDAYAITYILDGGTNASTNPASYTIDDAVTLAAPSRSGYTFNGWYTDAAFTQAVTGIAKGTTGDKTFYAKWTATAPVTPPPVNPDSDGRYPIGSYADLTAVAASVQKDPAYASASYYLTGNIDTDGQAWNQTIGTADHPFIGTFDGRDYYIQGLKPAAGIQGLFGVVGTGGTVKNLSVVDMDWTAAADIAGGLAGTNNGSISGCGSGINDNTGGTYDKNGETLAIATLNSDVKAGTAGGLVGINNGTITDSHSNASATGDTAGGMAGINNGSITNVYNTGTITASISGGGLIGINHGTASHGYSSRGPAGSGALGAIAGTSDNASLTGFYYTDTAAAACSNQSDSDLGAKPMGDGDMKTEAFKNTLNTDTQGLGLRVWTWKASQNTGYPRIEKSTVETRTLTDPATGIKVTGRFHPDANLSFAKLDTSSADYQTLAAAHPGQTVLKAYSLKLLYADGTPALYEGDLALSIPSSLLSYQASALISRLTGSQTVDAVGMVKNGYLSLTVADPGTFAIFRHSADYLTGTTGSGSQTSNSSPSGSKPAPATGLDDPAGTLLSAGLLMVLAGLIILDWRKKRKILKKEVNSNENLH